MENTSFPSLKEPVIRFDRDPIDTLLAFNKEKGSDTMTKEEFVTFSIRHAEDFPSTGEITPDAARSVLDNLPPCKDIPAMTPEEFTSIWNTLVHDPKVMNLF